MKPRAHLYIQRADGSVSFHGSTGCESTRDLFLRENEGSFYTIGPNTKNKARFTNEPCGYCGTSQNPNDICNDCWEAM